MHTNPQKLVGFGVIFTVHAHATFWTDQLYFWIAFDQSKFTHDIFGCYFNIETSREDSRKCPPSILALILMQLKTCLGAAVFQVFEGVYRYCNDTALQCITEIGGLLSLHTSVEKCLEVSNRFFNTIIVYHNKEFI